MKIRWGIIGLGKMANVFAKAINEIEDAEIVGVSSLTKNKTTELLNEFKITSKFFFKEYKELLRCKNVDAVYIATLNNSHADIITMAAQFDKNIMCEKPMSLDYIEAKKSIDEVKKKRVFFLEAFPYRSHPQTSEIYKVIKSNVIGKINQVEISFGFKKKIDPDHRVFNKNFGGGAILDVGCYTTSLSLLIAKIINPNVQITNFDIENVEGKICNTGVDEIANADLILNKDIKFKISTSIVKHMSNNCIIYGTNGKLVIQDPWNPGKKSFLEVYENDNYYKKFVTSKLSVYAHQINEFNKKISNNKKKTFDTLMSIEESLINMKILDQWKKKIF